MAKNELYLPNDVQNCEQAFACASTIEELEEGTPLYSPGKCKLGAVAFWNGQELSYSALDVRLNYLNTAVSACLTQSSKAKKIDVHKDNRPLEKRELAAAVIFGMLGL